MKRNLRLTAMLWPIITYMCLEARAQPERSEVPTSVGSPAQRSTVLSGDCIDSIKALQIGDTIPEYLWQVPLQVVNHPEGKQTITLADYKHKLIIIDFWATWCVPCIKSIEKLDTLQKEFKEAVAVIPVTYEDADKARPFFAARGWSLPTAVSQTMLRRFFPYRSIPHQIWIKDNIVSGITHAEDAIAANIHRMLQSDGHTLHTKRDILNYDKTKAISTYADRVGSPVFMSSALTGHIEGIPASVGRTKTDRNFIVFYTNVSIVKMYQRTLQVPNNRIMVRGSDISKYAYESGSDDNHQRFSYQLIVPLNTDRNVLKQRILGDLDYNFQLVVDSQVTDVDCYVIHDAEPRGNRPDSTKAPKSKQAYTLASLTSLLNDFVSWKPGLPVYINESHYSGHVMISPNSVKSMKYQPSEVKKELEALGLILKKETRPLTMYFITEREPSKRLN
ncbi:TlpA family protein disulfide reductase [Parapedobacter tibetensis]|uniref:TlpA family protein disulfide reductase n=1 Tax=Parapedobacter tibetensis TaxID=2972951 RepID=UPI00214D6483|nr:TlpA disulfide reductase family protein [Parapedobacter tibetensis]